ncbi:MAG: hypothetical protein HY535_08420 [Chloroflexi bacterium]|nr:hypothetical protein [Chloroflexota bacterium]
MVGTVVAVSASSIVVETQFGNVTIEVGASTVVDAPPEKNVGIEAIKVGSRVAISLNRPMVVGVAPPAATGTPSPTVTPVITPAATEPSPTPEPSFRTATASRIVVVPSEAAGTHQRGVVQGVTSETVPGKGRLKVLGENGQIAELELPEGAAVPGEGNEIVVIARGKGGHRATTDTPLELRGLQQAEQVAGRLERLQASFKESNPELAAKLVELQQKWQEQQQARLEKSSRNAPPEARENAQKALRKAKGECPKEGEAPPGCPKQQRQPEDKGPPEDKGKGSEGDKGKGPPEGQGQGDGKKK